MLGFHPVADAPISALPSAVAVDVRVLVLREYYEIVAPADIGMVLDETSETVGVSFAGLMLDELQQFAAPFDVGLVLGERYNVASGLGDILRLGERWAVVGASDVGLRLGERWATVGATLEALRLRERWAVASFDADAMLLDEHYFVDVTFFDGMVLDLLEQVTGVTPEALVFDEQWALAAPVSDSLDLTEQYELFTYATEALLLDEYWGFTMLMKRDWEIVYGTVIARDWEIDAVLGMDAITRDWEIDAGLYITIKRGWDIDCLLHDKDYIAREWEIPCVLLNDAAIIVATQPTATVRGQVIKLESAEVGIDEGQYAWTCQLILHDPAHYSLFGPDEPFTITFGTEEYSFIRNEPQFDRNGQVDLSANITGISPAAVHDDPRAERIEREWSAATLVSAVLEELFGSGEVELRVADWVIPAGRLGSSGQVAVTIAQQIARATGGLLESEPDGALYIRYVWPVPVPHLATAAADEVYDDSRDAFTISERATTMRVANKIRILDVTADTGAMLSAELDDREEGFNGGRTQFIPGDQPAFLIFRSDGVEVDSVAASAGNIVTLASGTREIEETLSFDDSDEATLRYPTDAIDSFKWLGNDLGTPVLIDGSKVKIPAAGIGVLMVSYEAEYLARRISGVPAVLNGETEYEVLAVVEGSHD